MIFCRYRAYAMTYSKYHQGCYSYYIAEPRCEVINCEPGTRIVKPGVSGTISCENPQPYINGRYGRGSVLLACKSTPCFELKSYIEKKVLDHLRYTFGYERPKYKKEHFIIEDTISAERTFVYIVSKLYDHYCGKYDEVLDNIISNDSTHWDADDNRLEMQRERRRKDKEDEQERLRKEKEDAECKEQRRIKRIQNNLHIGMKWI